MELGIVGLGRMGAGIALRLLEGGHQVEGFDTNPRTGSELAAGGLNCATSLDQLVDSLHQPRAVWLMVPAGKAVDDALDQMRDRLGPDAVVIDGGNSNYKDSARRARDLSKHSIHFLDVGTSGGIVGRTNGYCMTIGGDVSVVERLAPIFSTLAPAPERGWGRVGPSGSGHFVKMIHNGIEYGLMQAYAEGFAVLERKSEMQLDLGQIAAIWNGGSVIRSWLLELAGDALTLDPSLKDAGSQVDDSGEGRWAAAEAIELDVPAPAMTIALLARLQSRDRSAFSAKLLQALRHAFGGHKPSED